VDLDAVCNSPDLLHNGVGERERILPEGIELLFNPICEPTTYFKQDRGLLSHPHGGAKKIF
jgi:hypothetical protein